MKQTMSLFIFVLLIFIGVGGYMVYTSYNQPDTQCSSIHHTTAVPATRLSSASDHFEQGNFDFDEGNCVVALDDYTHAITLKPDYAEAYNNRGYTYMRLHRYPEAISDLNRAIELRHDYLNALMNRADIYNFYQVDRSRAIADYETVISHGGRTTTNVCGHLMLARAGGWTPDVLQYIPGLLLKTCQ